MRRDGVKVMLDDVGHSHITTRRRVRAHLFAARPATARIAVTAVDQLSHGRLDVGVGYGGNFSPFRALGVEKATFVSPDTPWRSGLCVFWS
ncbi:MAG: hypothetical protein NVSMB60_19100 [Mycobacterium sp.]